MTGEKIGELNKTNKLSVLQSKSQLSRVNASVSRTLDLISLSNDNRPPHEGKSGSSVDKHKPQLPLSLRVVSGVEEPERHGRSDLQPPAVVEQMRDLLASRRKQIARACRHAHQRAYRSVHGLDFVQLEFAETL